MPRTGRPREFDEHVAVDAAMRLFWKRGYEATSVQDLVDELAIKRGSLYGAFGDKHGLFLQALRRFADGMPTALVPADGPVLPALRALLLGVLELAVEEPGCGCMLGNTALELAPTDPAATEVVRAGFAALEETIRGALRHGRSTGEFPDRGDVDAQARLLVTVFEGLHVVAKAERDPRRLADVVDAALAVLR